MDELILVDSTEIKETFKNGKLKRTGLMKIYRHGDYDYEMNVGKHIRYYKDGSKTITVYDNWGTSLINTYSDSEDNLIGEYRTTKIETTTRDLDTYFKSNKNETYNVYYKDYRYDYDACKYYLRKEGEYSNAKRVGTWKFYEPNGELQKEKQY
jgi:antitoxin component YwqK of YwqJK toxin-antitoxin module